MRFTLLVVVPGGVIALVLIVWLRWPAPSGPAAASGARAVAENRSADDTHPAPPEDAAPDRTPVHVVGNLRPDAQPLLDSRLVEGWVVCAASKMPLASWVRAGDRGVAADPRSGRFRIDVKASDGEVLRFSADGYHERSLHLRDAAEREVDVGVIELEPRHSLLIRVVDASGAPIAGANVKAAASDPPGGRSDTLRELGLTDDRGVLSVKIGQPQVVFAHLGFRTSDVAQCDIDAECQLVVGSVGARLGLMDSETGQPIEETLLGVRHVSAYPQLEFTGATGTDGLFDAPLPLGQYTATLRSPFVFFDEGEPGARDSLPGIGARAAVVALGDGQSEPRWLSVSKRPSLVIEARDTDTRKLLGDVTAWISSWEEPPLVPEPAWTRMAGDAIHVTEGIVSLYAFGLLFRGQGGQLRLSITSPGYSAGHVVDPLATVTSGFPHVVLLQAGDTRSLQLWTAGGSGYRREAYVRENGNVVCRGFPDGDGRLSEFPWAGGELTLHSGPDSWSPRLAAVPGSLLHSEACPVVTIDADAEIRVQLARTPPPALVCVGERHERYLGRLDGDELVFDQLPPGRYEVGVPEALATLALRHAQGRETFPIALDSGEVRALGWDDAWTPLAGTLTGHVATVGIDAGDVEVVPRWGPPDLPLAGGDRIRRFPVGEDGTFRLAGVRVRPSSLMFVRSWQDSSLMPIGVGHPGEASVLACSPVTVVVPGEASQLARVTFTPGVEGYKVVGSFAMRAAAGTPIELGPLPVGTDRLHVVVGGKREDVDLSLRPGEPTLVQVE